MIDKKAPLYPGNPGSKLWWTFFYHHERYVTGKSWVTDKVLRFDWGRAEQAATDYGATLATRVRSASQKEFVVKSATDVWRFSVTYGDTMRDYSQAWWCDLASPCAAVRNLYSLSREPFLNPKTDPNIIKWSLVGAWLLLDVFLE